MRSLGYFPVISQCNKGITKTNKTNKMRLINFFGVLFTNPKNLRPNDKLVYGFMWGLITGVIMLDLIVLTLNK